MGFIATLIVNNNEHECYYAECEIFVFALLSVFMMSVFMLRAKLLSVVDSCL
jgi:hypothetical protein